MANTNGTCSFGKGACKNARHVTKSGVVRGYCAEHEALASKKSRAKIADGNLDGLCNDACMSALPESPCVCGCGGKNHAMNHFPVFVAKNG